MAALNGNGRLPLSDLGVVPGTSRTVRADLVPQVVAWRQAFAHEFGKPLVVTDGYRPYTGTPFAQVEIMLARYRPVAEYQRLYPALDRDWIVARKSHVWDGVRRYLLPGMAQTAFPGTSTHGWATAVDLGSGVNVGGSREHRWCVANAPTFGFRWPAEWARTAGEWWHFEGGTVVPVSDYVRIPGVSIPTPTKPLPPPLEEDDMFNEADRRELSLLRATVATLATRVSALGLEGGFRYAFAGTVYYANLATGAHYAVPDQNFHGVLIEYEPDVAQVDHAEHDFIRALCARAAQSIRTAVV